MEGLRMIGKQKFIVAMCIMTALSIGGCGTGKADDAIPMDTVKDNDERSVVSDDSVSVATDNPDDSMEEAAISEDVPYTKVYGNGSYFVKVGDKVYFHEYENAVAAGASQGGKFLSLGNGICYYDETENEINELSDATCCDELYLCGDEFYSTGYDDNGQGQIVRVSLDGDSFKVGPGSVEGISADGGLVALWCDDASVKHLDVLDREHLQYCRIDEPSDGALSFCGLTEKEIVYQIKTSEGINLYSMGSDNEEECLGTLSDLGVYGALECDDFLFDEANDRIFCVFAHYDGPVDSVEDYLVISAVPGKENSLELVSHGYNYELMPNLSYGDEPMLRLIDGELGFGFYDEDKLYLSHSYLGSRMLSRFVYGNLLWCDEKGNVQTIIKSFIPYMDRDGFVMQAGQVLGNEAYVLVAGVERDESSDYKLSQAFGFDRMYVLRIPLEKDAVAKAIIGDDLEKDLTFDAQGFESYIGSWRMDDFIIEDGYIPEHSRNMWIGITDDQELSFMDNEEYSGFPFMLSTSDQGGECLIVGYNEVLELTCTGKLSEVDGEEKLILEVQEKLESIDDPRPADWKGSFHRVTDEEWAAEW